ncbi:MAG: D-alanyl-D-alanine endopeptidase [Rubrivivax sp.]
MSKPRLLRSLNLCLALGLVLAVQTAAAAEPVPGARRHAAAGRAAHMPAPATHKAALRRGAPGKAGRAARKVAVVPARPSVGQLSGLHATEDDLALKSGVALVVDEATDEVLFSKNPNAVLPIASITKLMTALVVTEAGLPLDETLAVTQDDVDATAGNRSRLVQGTQLTRGEMLHLALMSSENRAAHVLGRSYPGGLAQFVQAMNAKAQMLGMSDTRYVEPTGLSSENRSSARDLARLVRVASTQPLIREYSTSQDAVVPVGRRQVQFRNTNGLVRNPEWDILVQKTGYISAAGRCLVMQAQLAGRQFIMVLLDSAGKYSRIADAERLRRWLAAQHLLPAGLSAGSTRQSG